MAISGIINTNVGALSTLNALNNTQGSLNAYLQQLSTGKSINGPADNPAGYAIAQRFQTQINGLNQAVSNGNQGVSLVQTATGAIQNQTSLLQQIRTTAVQAANASNTTSDRQALQGVVSQLLAQVQTIATQTQFNGQNLLDGTFAGAAFQVGANSNQIINAAVGDTKTNAMGNYTTTTSGAAYTSKGSFQAGGYDAGGSFTLSAGGSGNFTAGSALTIQGSVGNASVNVNTATESAANLAAAVNGVSAQTGVTAHAYTSVAFTATSGTYTFTLSNGSSGAATNAVNISADVTEGSNGQANINSLVTAINNQAAVTGVSAGTQTVNGKTELVLTNANGNNINISAGVTSGGTLISSGLAAGSTGSLQAVSGSSVSSVGGAIASGSANVLIQGAVQFESASSYAIGSGGSIGFSTQATSLSGSAVSNINVTTAAGAQQAIGIVDQAINYLNQQNGNLGAIQNRIQASVSNDQTTATNLQSAQSVVQDANIAQATSQLTKYQILQQAGISTLAQENSLQQSYLKLLP